MILNLKYDKQIIGPGVVLYKNAVNISDEDLDNLIKAYQYSFKYSSKYDKTIKNLIWHCYLLMDKKEEILYIQKLILKFMTDYIDTFPESVHTIQWQEKINIDIDVAGNDAYIVNPSASFIKENKEIDNIPFTRQIGFELLVDDDFIGGKNSWIYLKELDDYQLSKGDILIYPANYLFSRKQSSIISGRKMSLSTFFNGGKDFLAEDEAFIDPSDNLLFSYLR